MADGAESTGAEPLQQEGPLRSLLAAGIEALRTRLDLAAVELEIHLLGLLRTLVWAVAAMVCALLGLAFGVIALIAVLWSNHRVLGLAAGGLTFVALAVLFAVVAARTFQQRRGLLAGSLEQLESDQKQVGGSP
jgi:uncharacterized membrane protein YqjE